MAVDSTGESHPSELVIELRGRFSKEDVHRAIDRLGQGEIRAFHVELATDDPTAQPLPSFEAPESDGELEQFDEEGESLPEDQTTIEPVDEETERSVDGADVDERGGAEATEAESTETPTLRPDSGLFRITELLAERDVWVRAKEVRDSIPDEWEIPEDSVGSTLWQLGDRGLVEKRPYEEDKRQTEYRVTDTGRRAVERAGSEDETEADAEESEATEAET